MIQTCGCVNVLSHHDHLRLGPISALDQIEEKVDLKTDRAIVLSSVGWHQGVIGIVASRIVEKYNRPTVMIAIDGGEGKGSARSSTPLSSNSDGAVPSLLLPSLYSALNPA